MHKHHPLSENQDFSGIEPPLDLKLLCLLEFVRCGSVEEKNRVLYLSRINHGDPTKFEDAFFQTLFCQILTKIIDF